MAVASNTLYAQETAAVSSAGAATPKVEGNQGPTALSSHATSDHMHLNTKPSSKASSDTAVEGDADVSYCTFDPSAGFTGDLNTNNDLPSRKVLKRIQDYTVLDHEGKSLPFRNIISGRNVARRVLVIFIRHFFCGNCQEYLRTLTKSITPTSLLSLPTPTFIAVVGCGSPQLIPMYAAETSCPFPIYADPTKKLYSELGMSRTLNLGIKRPEYQRKGLFTMAVQSVVQGVRELGKGKAFNGGSWRGGDMQQVGGEFLFEPSDWEGWSPGQVSPEGEEGYFKRMKGDNQSDEKEGYGFGDADGSQESNAEKSGKVKGREEEKIVTWCHRMRNTRDHAEIPEMREVLGMPIDDVVVGDGANQKRWNRALGERKGTGLNGRTSKCLSPKRRLSSQIAG